MKRFSAYIDNHINPIVVKELRQAVNGRFVAAVLILFLLISVITMVISLINADDHTSNMGSGVLVAMNVILVITCLLFLPTYAGVRLASEWSDTNVDLLFISTIKPRAIVWGKVLATTILAALIYSACMPFMMLTFLLRGIDLPSILFVLALGFLGVVLSIQFGLFAATISSSRGFRALIALGVLAALVMMAIGLIGFSFEMVRWGMPTGGEFWWTVSALLVTFACSMALLNSFSVALITPASANRALPVRLTFMAVWLITLAMFTLISYDIGRAEPIMVWAFGSFIGIACMMFIAVCERESWGVRLRRKIPRNFFARSGAMLLYSGAAGGLMWAWLMAAATLAIAIVSVGFFSSLNMDLDEFIPVSIGIVLYGYAYAMSAVLLRKYLLGAIIRPEHTWSLAMVIGALGCALPMLLAYLMFQGKMWNHDEFYLAANPYSLHTRSTREVGLIFVGTWSALLTIAAMPWFAGQLRRFKPIGQNELTSTNESEEHIAALERHAELDAKRSERSASIAAIITAIYSIGALIVAAAFLTRESFNLDLSEPWIIVGLSFGLLYLGMMLGATIGLFQRSEYGRVLGYFVAAISLLNIPIGTIIGIILIMMLNQAKDACQDTA